MADKKLLYIVRYQLDKDFNLKAKFDGQMHAFQNLGFEVWYLGFDAEYFYLIHRGGKEIIGKTHFQIPAYLHTLFYRELYTLARKVLKRSQFDCVYWRYSPSWYASYQLAKYIHSTQTKLIYEYPTYPLTKEKQMSGLRSIFMRYSSVWQKKIDDLADGFVLIGEDANGIYNGKPAVNISNGINLEVIPARNRKTDPETVHILALASMSYWHGYDRLIRSLAAYTGSQDVMIHMVGGNDGGSLPEWKALAEELGLKEKVIFHGPKSGVELNEMFDLCDIGVNSLGMYRKGFSVTSELKTREYAARGLPFVCSVDDPALQHTQEPMWLRIANDDSIPDMEELVAFALRMRADETAVEKLRAYAKEYLTWESQYCQVFGKFNV